MCHMPVPLFETPSSSHHHTDTYQKEQCPGAAVVPDAWIDSHGVHGGVLGMKRVATSDAGPVLQLLHAAQHRMRACFNIRYQFIDHLIFEAGETSESHEMHTQEL